MTHLSPKSWRPTGRQLGRQLSRRDVWTYDEKIELAANCERERVPPKEVPPTTWRNRPRAVSPYAQTRYDLQNRSSAKTWRTGNSVVAELAAS
jgi:hypothetical protein